MCVIQLPIASDSIAIFQIVKGARDISSFQGGGATHTLIEATSLGTRTPLHASQDASIKDGRERLNLRVLGMLDKVTTAPGRDRLT